jgi:hypothetical protein
MIIDQQVAIVNVGANCKHYIKSPIFGDRRFEFIPVPAGKLSDKHEAMIDRIKDWPRYDSLNSFYNRRQKLAKYLPERTRDKWLSQPMHNDPLFSSTNDHNTYGDYYEHEDYPKAAKLWELNIRDYILFLAHLWD